MASASSTPLSLSSSSTAIDSKASWQSTVTSAQRVALPTLLPPSTVQSQIRSARTSAYGRKFLRNVVAMSTGETSASVVETSASVVETSAPTEEPPAPVAAEVSTTSTAEAAGETPDIVKTIQEAWDKVEDKYAVASLAIAALVALWGSTGLVSSIDRLPLIPGVFELVGIGYTVWFAYKNLLFTPDREALIKKVKDTYKEVIGSN